METDLSYTGYMVKRGEQGTPHLQGFPQLKKKCRFSTLKNKIAN